jgi:hypothetical protein
VTESADRKAPPMPAANLRELAQRRENGLEVTLRWDARSNAVSVAVVDLLDDRTFVLPVAAASALDAFYHPYAYAAA